jgi:hypothetical protein
MGVFVWIGQLPGLAGGEVDPYDDPSHDVHAVVQVGQVVIAEDGDDTRVIGRNGKVQELDVMSSENPVPGKVHEALSPDIRTK